MGFKSFEFLLFLPAVVFLYFLLPYKYRWILLLLSSYVFYMLWKVEYIILIVLSTVIDYFVGLKMDGLTTKEQRKPWLMVSLVANLGLLFVFKYFNFVDSNLVSLAGLMGWNYSGTAFEMALPVGISFYTFQTLSYSLDIYRGDLKPERNFLRFALFVSYFPQLVAGPVERARNILGQLTQNFDIDYDRISSGLKLMVWGFFKKVVIADRLAIYVDSVYNNAFMRDGPTFWVATYFFLIQIYCDFSGYTDIARGAARIMGINLMINFERPYFGKNISEYWKRWHISLTSWFRDYLFKPLGGYYRSLPRVLFNIFFVWMVTGVWHGANWTFIVSGCIHGILLSSRYLWRLRIRKMHPWFKKLDVVDRWPRLRDFGKIVLNFHLICITFIFFRANSISDAWMIFKKMLLLDYSGFFVGDKTTFVLGVALMAFLTFIEFRQEYYGKESPYWESRYKALRYLSYAFYIILIIAIGVFDESQFIYFQF